MREDHLALSPGEPIPAEQIEAVLDYTAGYDGRITATEATADIWERAVAGLGAALVKDIIQAYYAKHDPSKPERPPISPGWIRVEANTRMERAENLKRLPPPRRRGGPPPHIAEKFAAYKDKYPRLLQGKMR